MTEKIKLETCIARPPTRKCREVIANLEAVVAAHPDTLRLVVFERGAPFQEKPGHGIEHAMRKKKRIPLCFVDGKFLSSGVVPTIEEVEARISLALQEREEEDVEG
jgi:hypothetical protein